MFQRDPRAGAFLGGDRVSGQEIRDQNVIAAQTIANIVKSSLGPMGLDKMMVDNIGEVTITNDGATILSLLSVEHPAGRIFVDLAQKQDKEVGDGTTSVVIIAAELLRRANELVKAKIHPTTIITGYRLACKEAVKFMQDQLSIKVDALGREALINVAKTTMASKVIGNDEDLFAPMAVDAMLAVRTINMRGDIKYPVKAVNVLKAHGRSARESLFVQGYALNCTVASQAMKKRITNAKIACLDINLQKTRMQLGVQILVDDPSQLEDIRKQEAEITLSKIRKILAAGANVVLTTKGIDDMCLKEFVEAGAMAVRRCRKEDLRRIAKATGGTLVSSLANLEGEETFETSYLGSAEEVVQERISDDELILIKGTKVVNSASIVLRGANDYMLDEMERALHDTLSVIKRTLESGAVVPGGGAVESALSIYLENFATTLGSREQLAIAEFASALLSIPKQLAVNAAKDSTELVAKLRAYHNAAQNAPAGDPKKALLRYGLDLLNGEARDNVTAGVLEPTMSKVKSLKSAYEAAVSLLRIDDAIHCVPERESTRSFGLGLDPRPLFLALLFALATNRERVQQPDGIRCAAQNCDFLPLRRSPAALYDRKSIGHNPTMQTEPLPSFFPYLSQKFQSLVWSCLDSDLTKSAVFHAERYFAMDRNNHDSRHLYATALLREGQTYSALCLVNIPQDQRCAGCLEIKAKCCNALGRYREAREALDAALSNPSYLRSNSTSSRVSQPFSEAAAMHCRSGNMALKGNLPEKASASFQQALALNPHLWEAFEGLCAVGSFPEIDEIFPPQPLPVRRSTASEPHIKPIASGAGLFTPDNGGSGNLFRQWKAEPPPPKALRMAPPPGPRDSLFGNDSPLPDNSFQHHRPHRAHVVAPANTQTLIPRPLSSADEAGPAHKKLRSTTRQMEATKLPKPPKFILDEPLKKARARPALIFANIFSSPGRRSQPTNAAKTGVSSKSTQAAGPAASAATTTTNLITRRSTRLLGATTAKTAAPKPPHPPRERRRQPPKSRSRSIESEIEDEVLIANELAHSPSPPPVGQSSHSDGSPTGQLTSAHELAAQEEYESELADHYIYNLIRRFASATRALAMYDCQKCLDELEQLPHVHQRSPWVLAMVGRAHYEKLDYASAERAFRTVRDLEPHRLWDMEVYSTLLWHLQRTIDLSFLAQELMNINSRSSQAWIAVGNLFSLQKERSQALTCFRRAAQLEPSCAYAYTLSGHESIDEDLDKAIGFFQSALRADPRHYNAWYGLGTCYLRMSKIRLAEYHYRKAVEIHPNNAVLLGCVGMAIERRGDRDSALKLFNQAVQIAPENALVRYRRAKILVSMRKYESAVRDLEHLRNTSPEESNVVFQLARVYRLIGDEVKSAQMLAVARDISPKSLNKMKKLLETVKDELGDDKMDEG
ncbi:hypothetical protein AX16_004194 [Volvariella volvacea WC 439]|nr:hypothetical protein AX16_004194 [Volvariella volvacea WC 439]